LWAHDPPAGIGGRAIGELVGTTRVLAGG
jgi:hypothetical protein